MKNSSAQVAGVVGHGREPLGRSGPPSGMAQIKVAPETQPKMLQGHSLNEVNLGHAIKSASASSREQLWRQLGKITEMQNARLETEFATKLRIVSTSRNGNPISCRRDGMPGT